MTSERYYQTDFFGAKGGLLPAGARVDAGVLLYGCEAALELGW